MDNSPEKFWIQNPVDLFRMNNFYKIIPLPGMSREAMFNSITRLLILIALVILILTFNWKNSIIPIVLIILVAVLYFITAPKVIVANPPPIIETYEPLDVDPDHISPYDKNHLSGQSAFAQWAYSSPLTCKEDPSRCQIHQDLRYHKVNHDVDY